jgi:hypothetical protein
MSIYETPAITPSAPVADDQQAPKLALQDQDGSACPTDIVIPDYIADVGTGGLHVRQSSRVMSSAKPPHDDNLLATAETGETASPASDESALSTRIAAFKHARAQRKQRALAVLLNLSLVVLVVALGVGYWTSFTSNTEISYTELRPDGTLIHKKTPLGEDLYWAGIGMDFIIPSLIASLDLPLEALASEVTWVKIMRTRRLPSAAALSLYAMQPYLACTGVAGIVKKFGWPSKAGAIALILHWVFVGRCQFAAEPGAGNLLMRRTTYVEFCVMYWTSNVFTLYFFFHIYCIHDGQWDGKTIGKAGGVLMVLLELAVGVMWFAKYARFVFSPGAPAGKERADVVADSWVGGLLAYATLTLINYVVLLPDDEDNRVLVTMTDTTASSTWIAPFWVGLGPLPFFFHRRAIVRMMSVPLLRRQRLQDGSFIAALLESCNGTDGADMMEEAGALFRGVPFSKISPDVLRSSKGMAADYALSQPCKLNAVDFFISHSWSDDPDLKYSHLASVAANFERVHGREPIFWLDKLCIDQDDISRALRCLPVFVFSCKRLLVLAGNTYTSRLWCVWELYVFFSMSPDAVQNVDLVSFAEAGTPPLSEFDVADAHCYSEEDEAKLRSIIESEGASDFNDMIREVAEQLVEKA